MRLRIQSEHQIPSADFKLDYKAFGFSPELSEEPKTQRAMFHTQTGHDFQKMHAQC